MQFSKLVFAAFVALATDVIAAPIRVAANDDLVSRGGRTGAIWYAGNNNVASQFGSANFDSNAPTAVTAGVIGGSGFSFAGGQNIDQATSQNLLNGVANTGDLHVSNKRSTGPIWYVGNTNLASQFGSANFDSNEPTAVAAGIYHGSGTAVAGGQYIDQATSQNLLNGVANTGDLHVSNKRSTGPIWYAGNNNLASQFGSANFDSNAPTAVTAGVIGGSGFSFAGGQNIDQATSQNLLNGVANTGDLHVSNKRSTGPIWYLGNTNVASQHGSVNVDSNEPTAVAAGIFHGSGTAVAGGQYIDQATNQNLLNGVANTGDLHVSNKRAAQGTGRVFDVGNTDLGLQFGSINVDTNVPVAVTAGVIGGSGSATAGGQSIYQPTTQNLLNGVASSGHISVGNHVFGRDEQERSTGGVIYAGNKNWAAQAGSANYDSNAPVAVAAGIVKGKGKAVAGGQDIYQPTAQNLLNGDVNTGHMNIHNNIH